MTTIAAIPTKYSHLTQVAINYFPDTDVRIRENPVSLGAQLLNSVASQMEYQQVRLTRELRALNLSEMPMNIDNSGVYYATLVPSDFSLLTDDQGNLLPPTFIKGRLLVNSITLINLVPYNDLLPVPTRVSLDPILKPVALSNPRIINTVGNGTPQSFNPGVLPLPNFLTFNIQGMGPVTTAFTISITGELDPPGVWPQDIQSKNEVLIISDDGFYHTDSVWSSISQIDITGLPTDCSCICYSLPVGLQTEPDTDRPFTHFAYRNVTFPRYWQLQDLVLAEQYKRNRLSGNETHQVYHLPTQMVDIAVEPNTNGLFLTDGTSLFYMDRRTPMPDNLFETGLTQEPIFGLNVWYDYNKPGDTQYAFISPVPRAKASTTTQYRYVVEDPNGNVFVLLPTGILQTYTGSTGWTQGSPKSVSFPLTEIGTYVISLEILGAFNAKTVDVFPYSNLAINSLATINLANLVPAIQGIAFDAYDRLWIWTGDFAVPIKLSYDAYLWDPSTRTIYTTDKYYSLVLRLNDN
jgi:hypothetical protein